MMQIFEAISKTDIVGCFQRLVCDISSRQKNFQEVFPIVEGIKLAQDYDLQSPTALKVSQQLMSAIAFGDQAKDVGKCEQKFNRCQWTGQQMTEVTLKFKEMAEAPSA